MLVIWHPCDYSSRPTNKKKNNEYTHTHTNIYVYINSDTSKGQREKKNNIIDDVMVVECVFDLPIMDETEMKKRYHGNGGCI